MKKRYEAERFEEIFEQSAGEKEYEEAVRAKGVKCYRAKVTEAGRIMDINLGAVWNTRKEAVKAAKAKRGRSAAAIERAHHRRDEERVTAIVNANFGEGDKALHLTFRDSGHPDALKAWNWYVRTVRRIEKKRGLEKMKAVGILEETSKDGEPLRQHIHAVMKTGLTRDELEKIWQDKYGYAHSTILSPDENGLCAFAAYVLKASPAVRNKRRWSCTQNCVRPEPKRSTRLPNGKKLTKKLIYGMVSGTEDARRILETAYPGWRLIAFSARTSEYVSGVWIDIRMTRCGGGAG